MSVTLPLPIYIGFFFLETSALGFAKIACMMTNGRPCYLHCFTVANLCTIPKAWQLQSAANEQHCPDRVSDAVKIAKGSCKTVLDGIASTPARGARAARHVKPPRSFTWIDIYCFNSPARIRRTIWTEHPALILCSHLTRAYSYVIQSCNRHVQLVHSAFRGLKGAGSWQARPHGWSNYLRRVAQFSLKSVCWIRKALGFVGLQFVVVWYAMRPLLCGWTFIQWHFMRFQFQGYDTRFAKLGLLMTVTCPHVHSVSTVVISIHSHQPFELFLVWCILVQACLESSNALLGGRKFRSRWVPDWDLLICVPWKWWQLKRVWVVCMSSLTIRHKLSSWALQGAKRDVEKM